MANECESATSSKDAALLEQLLGDAAAAAGSDRRRLFHACIHLLDIAASSFA
jgi:hypothetical protein